MIILMISVALFNLVAFKTNKRLTANQIVHIWCFTVASQGTFDAFVDFKYHAYWYFGKGVDWSGLIPHTVLIPPVNIIFLAKFPFNAALRKKIIYIGAWVIGILIYEQIVMLPEPWGYFHYGWWNIWHSVFLDPLLFLFLIGYYKWICKLEKKALAQSDT